MTRQEIVSLRVRRAVTKDVGLAGVMLYVPLVVTENVELAAWTDGSKVYFGPLFFKLTDEEQVGTCVHEALHVIFRHVQRGIALYEREGSAYQQLLWNLACDAVINRAIREIHNWAVLPADAVRMESLLEPTLLKKKPPHLWTAEQVYEELKKQPASDFATLAAACDLAPGPGGAGQPNSGHPDRHEREMETRKWRERIVRAQAGSPPGGLLRKLASDVPHPQVRWEVVLREFLKARCMPVTEISWARPSRRTLSLGEKARFIDPGSERKKGLTRIGIVVDTSGSIDDDILRTFLGEINGIMRASGAEAVVVDCDAAVHQVRVFQQAIRAYTPIGGGGTDFSPGLEELARQRVTVAVYLTDLCGTFPAQKPRFPVLWAATEDREVPFGRKVVIPAR